MTTTCDRQARRATTIAFVIAENQSAQFWVSCHTFDLLSNVLNSSKNYAIHPSLLLEINAIAEFLHHQSHHYKSANRGRAKQNDEYGK